MNQQNVNPGVGKRPWVPVSEVYDHFGYKNQKSALTAITMGKFPVETFRVGRVRAIHREVYDAYFDQFKDEGLERLLVGTK